MAKSFLNQKSTILNFVQHRVLPPVEPLADLGPKFGAAAEIQVSTSLPAQVNQLLVFGRQVPFAKLSPPQPSPSPGRGLWAALTPLAGDTWNCLGERGSVPELGFGW